MADTKIKQTMIEDLEATIASLQSQISEVTLLENTFTGQPSIDIEPVFDDAVYKRGYEIEGWFTVSTNDARPHFTMKVGGTYRTSSYNFGSEGRNSGAAQGAVSINSSVINPCSTAGSQGISNASTTKAYFKLKVMPFAEDATIYQRIDGIIGWTLAGVTNYNCFYDFFGHYHGAVGTLDGIRFAPSAGTITGRYIVKGLK